jgi:hypothetical protein
VTAPAADSQRVVDGAGGRRLREARLVGIDLARPALVHDARPVTEDDVLAGHPEPHIVLGRGDSGGPGAGEDHLQGVDRLARHFKGVEQSGAGDDRRPVLIVMEDGNAQRAAERFLNIETVRGTDVLEVDSANRRLEQLAELYDVVRVLGADLEIEDIEVGELLEQVRLALHDGLARHRSDVPQAEDGGAIGNHRDEVSLGGVLVDEGRVALDLEAGFRDAGGIGEGEIPLVRERFCRNDGDLPRPAVRVIVEGILALCHRAGS